MVPPDRAPSQLARSGVDPRPERGTWIDFLDRLTDELADREEAIECELEDLTVDVPMSMSPDAETARWRVDGTVRIRVGEVRTPLREWLQWWHDEETDAAQR